MGFEFKELIGKVFKSVVACGDSLTFTGEKEYQFYHKQDCCENVYIEDITGDLKDLEDSPILLAEEISSEGAEDHDNEESYTWTFYKFATVKGDVTVRWLGTSNGYYSESVSFREVV